MISVEEYKDLKNQISKFFVEIKSREDCIKKIKKLEKTGNDLYKKNNLKNEQEVFFILLLLSFCFYIYNALSIKEKTIYKENKKKLTEKISNLIKIIAKNNWLKKDTKGWLEDLTSKTAGEELKKRLRIFDNMVQGKEFELEAFALHRFLVFTNRQEKTPDISYFSYYGSVCVNDNEWLLMKNYIVMAYWLAFIDVKNPDKRYFYTEQKNIEKRIRYDRNLFYYQYSSGKTIEDVVRWLSYDSLFRGNEKDRIFEGLFRKVFFDENPVKESAEKKLKILGDFAEETKKTFGDKKDTKEFFKILLSNLYEDDTELQPAELFYSVKEAFIDDLDKFPAVVICLYMLLKEIPYEDFAYIFPNKKTAEQIEHEIYDIDFVDETLQAYASIPDEIKNENGMEFIHLFENYEEDLKNASVELKKKLYTVNSNDSFKKDMHLIQLLLYFAIQDKIGVYQNSINPNSRGDDFFKDFWRDKNMTILFINNSLIGNKNWHKPEEMNKTLNEIAKMINFQKENPFTDFDLEKVNDNSDFLILLFNLSRIQPESREHIISQLNYLREKQRTLLPNDRRYSSYDFKTHSKEELKKNQEILQKIDCGFEIKDFRQEFYPFTTNEFYEKLSVNTRTPIPMARAQVSFFQRNLLCKFVCETDRIYFENEDPNEGEGIDFRASNKKCLETRYLYKDRNIATHFGQFDIVTALTDPKNWKNLLYALCDIQESIEKILKNQTVGNPNIKHSPSYFECYYFGREVHKVYSLLCQKIQEAANIHLIQEFKMYDENGKSRVEEFIEYIKSKKPNTQTQEEYKDLIIKNLNNYESTLPENAPEKSKHQERLLVPRLKKILNIAFAVNGSNEDGTEHNTTGIDFFKRYNSEISLYLFYLTWEFYKLKKDS